jgi:hypothetical protein
VAMPDLIFCAGQSHRFAEIANRCGFLYGCRSDHKPTLKVEFADVNYKKPDFQAHADFVNYHRPKYAVVPDIFNLKDLDSSLRYAETLQSDFVIIVPKIVGIIPRLAKNIVIGFSIPSSYGAAPMGLLDEIGNRPVHLLGGSPQMQLRFARYIKNIVSVDGNMTQKAATMGTFYDAKTNNWASKRRGEAAGTDMIYRAFERSMRGIVDAWNWREMRTRKDIDLQVWEWALVK